MTRARDIDEVISCRGGRESATTPTVMLWGQRHHTPLLCSPVWTPNTLCRRRTPSKRVSCTVGAGGVRAGRRGQDHFGRANADSEGLFRSLVTNVGLCVPESPTRLQMWLMMSAHMGARGCRGQASTLHALRPACVWSPMEKYVTEVARKGLVCTLHGHQSGGIEAEPAG